MTKYYASKSFNAFVLNSDKKLNSLRQNHIKIQRWIMLITRHCHPEITQPELNYETICCRGLVRMMFMNLHWSMSTTIDNGRFALKHESDFCVHCTISTLTWLNNNYLRLMTASLSTNKALDEAPLGFGRAFIENARQIKNLHRSSFAVIKADLNHGNISQSFLHVCLLCGCHKSSTHVQHLNNELKFDFPF